jgi:hypothetical protein
MKNIHLIPTDKPTRLFTSDSVLILAGYPATTFKTGKNIHITSDEEIKEGDWYFDGTDLVHKKTKYNDALVDGNKNAKKIILTTDKSLDSVQTIDDEFLNWFVQNPSCEEIGVLTNNMKNADYIEVAERLYKYINPTSKMDCPNSVYITTEKWYYEWLNTETDLDLFDWCIKFKNK